MDEIKATGQGFFKKSGELKTKEELRIDGQKPSAKDSKVEAQSNETQDRVRDIQQNIIANVTEKANVAVGDINSLIDKAKQGASLNREANKIARELKNQLKEQENNPDIDNSADIEVSLKRLAELDEKRANLKRDIESGNTNQAVARRINVGNREVGRVEPKPVELTERKISGASIKTSEDAKNFIVQNREENRELRNQIGELRSERREAAELGRTGRNEVRQVFERVIEELDFGAAQELASNVAQEIRNLGQQLATSNPSENTVNTAPAPTDVHNLSDGKNNARIIQSLQG